MTRFIKCEAFYVNVVDNDHGYMTIWLDKQEVRLFKKTDHDLPISGAESTCVYLKGDEVLPLQPHIHILESLEIFALKMEGDIDVQVQALQLQTKLKDGIINQLRNELSEARTKLDLLRSS